MISDFVTTKSNYAGLKSSTPVVKEVPQLLTSKLLLCRLIVVEIIYFLVNELTNVKQLIFEIGVVTGFDNHINAIGKGYDSARVHTLLAEKAVNHSNHAGLKMRFEHEQNLLVVLYLRGLLKDILPCRGNELLYLYMVLLHVNHTSLH